MATRRTAPTHLVPVRVFRMPGANEDVDVDVGAVLCRTTDSLVEFRAVLKQHAAQPELSDDEEEEGEEGGAGAEGDDGDGLDPALAFMREGKFEFYLDEGKTRVRRKQEKGMKVSRPAPRGVGRRTHSAVRLTQTSRAPSSWTGSSSCAAPTSRSPARAPSPGR